jgi:hypothetical protein
MAPAWHVWVLSASGVVVAAVRLATVDGARALRAAGQAPAPWPVWLVLPALLLFCGAIVGGVVWQAERREQARRRAFAAAAARAETPDGTRHDVASRAPRGEQRSARPRAFARLVVAVGRRSAGCARERDRIARLAGRSEGGR